MTIQQHMRNDGTFGWVLINDKMQCLLCSDGFLYKRQMVESINDFIDNLNNFNCQIKKSLNDKFYLKITLNTHHIYSMMYELYNDVSSLLSDLNGLKFKQINVIELY